MKSEANRVSTEPSAVAILDPQRCQFSSADGRRCRLPRCEAHPAFCPTHARAEVSISSPHDRPPRCHPEPGPDALLGDVGEGSAFALDLDIDLAPSSGEFRTATDVNRALGKLFLL